MLSYSTDFPFWARLVLLFVPALGHTMHWVNPRYVAVTNFIATGICDACAFGTAAAGAEAEAEYLRSRAQMNHAGFLTRNRVVGLLGFPFCTASKYKAGSATLFPSQKIKFLSPRQRYSIVLDHPKNL